MVAPMEGFTANILQLIMAIIIIQAMPITPIDTEGRHMIAIITGTVNIIGIDTVIASSVTRCGEALPASGAQTNIIDKPSKFSFWRSISS